MKKINSNGFTLVELIATIVLLGIIMGIGTYSVTMIINNSREKDYDLLIKYIKDASELYYQECKYGDISDTVIDGCNKLGEGITLGNLVEFGYLTGNSKDDSDKYTLVNPKDGKNISDCIIKITYNSGVIDVDAIESGNNSCPTGY